MDAEDVCTISQDVARFASLLTYRLPQDTADMSRLQKEWEYLQATVSSHKRSSHRPLSTLFLQHLHNRYPGPCGVAAVRCIGLGRQFGSGRRTNPRIGRRGGRVERSARAVPLRLRRKRRIIRPMSGRRKRNSTTRTVAKTVPAIIPLVNGNMPVQSLS